MVVDGYAAEVRGAVGQGRRSERSTREALLFPSDGWRVGALSVDGEAMGYAFFQASDRPTAVAGGKRPRVSGGATVTLILIINAVGMGLP
jgi:hypothetical protein